MSVTATAGANVKASTGVKATGGTNPTCALTGCGVKVNKGGLCSGCRSVNYCSKEHQRSDWPSHKSVCCADVKKSIKEVKPERKVSSMDYRNPSAWADGLGQKKQREWLVDCYRMRLDDEYALEGDVRGGSLYDQSEPNEIVQDFLVFCRLAKEKGVLPEGWNWSKFLDTAAELLPYAFEKSDAKEKYGGENVFAFVTGGRSLRSTGEMIYGSSFGAFAEESQEHKRLMRELKDKKRTSEMVEEVGGKKVWDTLEWKLWRNMPDAQPEY